MPYYSANNGEVGRVPVLEHSGGLRLTVCTDIDQPDCDVSLHSGESRFFTVATGAGLVVDDLELDPEVIEVRVTPTAGGPTAMTITLHASRD